MEKKSQDTICWKSVIRQHFLVRGEFITSLLQVPGKGKQRGCVKMIIPGCFEKVNHCSCLHVLRCSVENSFALLNVKINIISSSCSIA